MVIELETVTEGQRGLLALDVRARAVFVDGQRLELSPKEFELLAELAARPGEPISTKELIRSVWPGSFGMTTQEVRWHIWNLRQAIGDDKRESMIVANRRGFGYLIDLASHDVQLVDPQVSTPTDVGEPSVSDERTTQPQTLERSRSRPRKALVLLASGSALVLLAGTWVAASRRPGSAPDPRPPIASGLAERSQPNPLTNFDDMEHRSQSDKRKGVGRGMSRRSSEPSSVGEVFDSGSVGYPVASSATDPSDPSPEGSGDSNHSSQEARKDETPPAPQPNAELFHLYNADTGDHFVTMSSATANQKQASGYRLVVEGGVFTDQVKGTVAIDLDDGRAYVFRDRNSTPMAGVSPLYRIEKDGDFFYTSSSSTANQAEAQGWTRATVGYVAT